MSLLKECEVGEIEAPVHIISRVRPTFVDLARDLKEVETIGKWIAKSKFFNLDYEEQGFIIASECYLSGMSILEYAKRNKVVAGKPFKQYDTMLAEFREQGGSHKILSQTPDLASVEFTTPAGETSTHSLSWEEARKEVFPYVGKEQDIVNDLAAGKEPKLKTKYATPRSRATMLLARLVSATIRAICPEVNYGVYTEEEIDDIPRETPVRETAPQPARQSRTVASESVTVAPPATPAELPEVKEEVKAAESEIPKLPPTESGPSTVSTSDPLLDTQYQRIVKLMVAAVEAGDTDIKNKVVEKLKASGLEKLRDMSIAEGELLISSLTEKNFRLWLDASLLGAKRPS